MASTQISHWHPLAFGESGGLTLSYSVDLRPPARLQFELSQAPISQQTLPELNIFLFVIDAINIPVTQNRVGRFFRKGNADVRAVAMAGEGHRGGI